jgi:hypothetical protein
MTRWRLALLFILLPVGRGFADDAPPTIPVGSGQIEVRLGDAKLDVFTYKPADYDAKNGPLMIVFHGVLRNADTYRDNGKPLADHCHGLVVAPKFPADTFPTASYQFGNLLANGKANPPERWTWSLVPKLAVEIRRRERRPDMPYDLIGHSGGGQFLVRLAGFATTGARRVVAANPGSELFPDRDRPFPYGFGKLPDELSNDEVLRRYLAQPLVLYLGTGDVIQDEYFDKRAEAMKQGASRLERGRNVYKAAQELATAKGWPLKWELVEASDVPHDAAKMFAHPQCWRALTK